MSDAIESAVRALVIAVCDEMSEQRNRAIAREELERSERTIAHLNAENERLRARMQRYRNVVDAKPHSELIYTPRQPNHAIDKAGLIYAVALVPEVSPFRIKIGYTSKSIGERVGAFITTCPTAKAIGGWAANPRDEDMVLGALPNRIGDSEVFICSNVEALLVEIDRVMRDGLP